jgi:hypothetical protein
MTAREWIMLASLLLAGLVGLGSLLAFLLSREARVLDELKRLRAEHEALKAQVEDLPDWREVVDRLDQMRQGIELKIDGLRSSLDELRKEIGHEFRGCVQHRTPR